MGIVAIGLAAIFIEKQNSKILNYMFQKINCLLLCARYFLILLVSSLCCPKKYYYDNICNKSCSGEDPSELSKKVVVCTAVLESSGVTQILKTFQRGLISI